MTAGAARVWSRNLAAPRGAWRSPGARAGWVARYAARGVVSEGARAWRSPGARAGWVARYEARGVVSEGARAWRSPGARA